MSGKAQTTASGKLHACGGLGVSIRITDGVGREVRRGIEEVEVSVPEGLYAVEWSSAGLRDETFVRIPAGRRITVRPNGLAGDPDAIDSAFRLAAETPYRIDMIASSQRPDTSALVVDIRDRDDESVSALVKSVRLLDPSEAEVSPDGGQSASIGPKGAILWNDVTPGRYRLRFLSVTGETLDQTIPVLGNRVTVVRMTASRATVLVQEGEGFVSTRTRGIDPTRTVVTTSLRSDEPALLRKQARLAETLLRDLAGGTGSLSKNFVKFISEDSTDPLLRIYAALVAVNCLDLRTTPAMDEDWPEEAPEQEVFERSWCRRAKGWLAHSRRAGMPPDATAALWQIDHLLASGNRLDRVPAFGSIKVPPMLECAWRWAIARSTLDRNALQGHAAIRAAARSAGGTTPWLCWQPAAAKAVNSLAPAQSEAQLEQLLAAVVEKTKRLRERQKRSGLEFALSDELPPDVTVTALRSEQVTETANAYNKVSGGASPVAALSIALSLPQAALGTRLARTSEELDRVLAAPDAISDKNQAGVDAPGWTKRVRHGDDPNRGRFGGNASAGGFRLEADFALTKNKNWSSVFLAVKGPAADGELVVIYLHDSFRPPRRELRFEGGVARLKVTSWGGFTVGAWIPSRRIELELDLAAVDGAPRIIRER